jgi:hypothetical protein
MDRKRQRAAKARGEAVTSEEAVRRRKIHEKVPIYGVGEAPLGVILGVLALQDDRRRRVRLRLLAILRARLRQLSPI